MFRNSMKKIDEVNNILVDVSWRFTTVIIIDCIVFMSICLCLISAIRSYNKNVKLQLHTNIDVVQGGLRSHNIIKDNEYVDGTELQKAIDGKNIIIRDNKNDFNNIIIGDGPYEYTHIMKGEALFGVERWFCIKNWYWNLFKRFLIFTL